MALFGTDGTMQVNSSAPSEELFLVKKKSSGETMKVYKVPSDKAQGFQDAIKSDLEALKAQAGEDVTVVKVSKIV